MDQRARDLRSMSGQKRTSNGTSLRLVERLSAAVEVAGRAADGQSPYMSVEVSEASLKFGGSPMLDDSERHRALYEWNDTRVEFPSDKCVHEMFEEQVARTPDATALVFEGASISYLELNQRANRFARHLVKLGVKPDERVAICAERSFEMVVALLAVLKAGGAYLPLDPAYPVDRLRYMLEDSAPAVVLMHAEISVPVQDMIRTSGIATIDLHGDAERWESASAEN